MSKYLPLVALLISLALIAVCSLVPIRAMWGLNHLQYLPKLVYFVLVAVAGMVIGLSLVSSGSAKSLDQIVDGADSLLFGRSYWPSIVIALTFGALFYAFRLQTHFLGDGYILLSTFGQGDTYVVKWTETGACLVIRWIQLFVTDTTRDGALHAFQGLACGAGVIAVFSTISLCRYLSDQPSTRLLSLVTLLTSGVMLLYFGYVEFYPMLWAAVTAFLAAGARYIRTKQGLVWAILLYALCVFIHLQSLCLLFAFVYLIIRATNAHPRNLVIKRWHKLALVIFTIVGTLVVIRLSHRDPSLELVFLPMFKGRPGATDYAIFSLKHALDLINLIFLIVPGTLLLTAVAFRSRQSAGEHELSFFLFLASLGSLAFVLCVDPAFGMARDWDLMSVCILPPLLWLMNRAARSGVPVTRGELAGFTIVSVTATLLFITVNVVPSSSETRVHNLLNYYGAKNNSGWSILAGYYYDRGEIEKSQEVAREMASYFPDDARLAQAHVCLSRGESGRALELARSLYDANPYRSDYVDVLGDALSEAGQYTEAIAVYHRAVRLRPYWSQARIDRGQVLMRAGRNEQALATFKEVRNQDPALTVVLENIALAYINLRYVDSANLQAESLFAIDPQHPGGHLIEMVTAISQLDTAAARFHFEQYLKYGQGRSDYERIRDYYGYLAKR